MGTSIPAVQAVVTPDFSSNVTNGTAPLPVRFWDGSTSPLGWAWFFGDETYAQPWTEMNASSGWEKRYAHTSVVLPDGSIVLMGGAESGVYYRNDTWRSTDKGATWTLMNASSGWMARYDHSSVALLDGSIVLMGGWDDSGRSRNDVWRSVDKGAHWTLMNGSAGWSPRFGLDSVALPDNSIVLTGGNIKNDTWRSTDLGRTWTLQNSSPGWWGRTYHSIVAMPDGSIILQGGYTSGNIRMNDTWRSTDKGAHWTLMNGNSPWLARGYQSSVALPDNSIILMGGYTGTSSHDVWRSADNGTTWRQVNASAGWPARYWHSSVALPDGSIIVTGGRTNSYYNDTWRFQPVGSSLQHPSHLYTSAGNYTVALQAFNPDEYNSTRKAGYITVFHAMAMVGVYRPSIHTFILKNGTEKTILSWGLGSDTPVAGDWNGDGLGDVGVFRPSIQTFILKNGTEKTIIGWGLGTDTPVSGDWDGDGLGGIGVYRPSIAKFILKNGTEKTIIPWGLGTDTPVAGDWNGDGLGDVGVFRPSIAKFILKNGTEKTIIGWGLVTDTPVSGDWNGDGLTDVGVYRSSIHAFILKNGTERTVVPWGLGTDIPVTGRWS